MQFTKSLTAGAVLAALAAGLLAAAPVARAGDAWSFPMLVQDPPRKTVSDAFNGKEMPYTALESTEVSKKHNACFLVPHTTNTILLAYIYGAVEEFKRFKMKYTIMDAGGYGNQDKQLAQFDDCMALNPDLIILMAVSPDAFTQKVMEARAKGIKVVDYNNGVNAEVDGRALVTYVEVGKIIGKGLAAKHGKGSGEVTAVLMPGPAGVPWSEDTVKGFKEAIEGSDVKLEKVVYGNPARADQQPLVEDVLTTYPKLTYLVGMGTSLEVALSSLREQGRLGEIGLYGTFITPDVMKAISEKQVAGVVVENSLLTSMVAVDIGARLLEGKATVTDAIPTVTLVDASNVADVPKNNFAPDDYKPEMSGE
jgi:protein TorT